MFQKHWQFGATVLLACGLAVAGCASTPATTGTGDAAAQAEPGEGVVHTATEAERTYLTSKQPIDAEQVTLAVNGLSCPLCASNVDKQLEGVRGVEKIKIDFAAGVIDLGLSEPRPSPAMLARAIDQAGFTLIKIEKK